MAILWTTPVALAGLALIALPVLVHLFARQQVRTLAYPSLRFLVETQLAAFRRRRIQDALLLLCRAAIVAAAAVALAGPVFQTGVRTAAQANRISRAMVVIEPAPTDATTRIADGAFGFAVFQRMAVADALEEAVRWLNAQPRSAREIVIAGALRRGSITGGELATIPPDIGLRFEQAATAGAEALTLSRLERRGGVLYRVDSAATVTAEATRVVEGASTPVAEDLVAIRSAPRDAALADAALRAALGAGVPWRDFDRRVVVAWDGADTSSAGDAQVVRMPVPSPASAAADAVRTALARAGAPGWIEPQLISRAELDGWSRAPGAPFRGAPTVDEGDRRWLWAVALVLLAIEWLLRRSAPETSAVGKPVEAKVA
jgi:hypothetical protein